jgi:ATPase family protein associated with various cellular activities (AAA)/winged helix domain-containing protein
MSESDMDWFELNQRHLVAALGLVREALERYAARDLSEPSPAPGGSAPRAVQLADETQTGAARVRPALEVLCERFGLSGFERDVLLLCAGVELDAACAQLCARAHGDPERQQPTFGLALAALPGAHWSALSPAAPLRRWRLVEVFGDGVTRSPLRIDERVLHHLTGLDYLDERLSALAMPVRDSGESVPTQRALAERLAAAWMQSTPPLPVLQLCGDDSEDKRAVAAQAFALLGLGHFLMSAQVLPSNPTEVDTLARLWTRESVLSDTALLLDCDELDASDAGAERSIARMVEAYNGPLVILTRERLRPTRRNVLTFDVSKPTPSEQRAVWRRSLGSEAQSLNGAIETLTSQFFLGTRAIVAASNEALSLARADGNAARGGLGAALWDACRSQARPRLDNLAQRIEPAAGWDDLVLPAPQVALLREIAAQVRQRATVYEKWGFAEKGSRGLGVSALFAGSSGTGKTMAAEVLARELRLDLYRIDLSSVVSKYIGETEKNLRRVFDAAETGGAILLFDEADAIFGKRSEVKDSHDRYANIEVSYLLQRMESYRGLAILTTNLKSSLDTSFMRRIRFVVPFPFPDATQRADIWRRIFPTGVPTDGLDPERLARLNVAGGNIRNIALGAAFLAADAGEPVRMSHLLRAARGEYAKLEKPLTEAEIGGWI